MDAFKEYWTGLFTLWDWKYRYASEECGTAGTGKYWKWKRNGESEIAWRRAIGEWVPNGVKIVVKIEAGAVTHTNTQHAHMNTLHNINCCFVAIYKMFWFWNEKSIHGC